MAKINFSSVGSIGVNKDLSVHDMPPSETNPSIAWTDAQNIRFLDGMAYQFYGHSEVYNSPSFAPQHILPCNVAGVRYWIYTTAAKTYCVTVTAGSAVHTDITHVTPRTGVVNSWTSTLLSGIPVLNTGDTSSVPMSWDLNTAHKFVDLANWPANTYCKSIRAFKNSLIALNVTKSGTSYPFMVKWSHPADPGTVPSSWDPADATKDAGETDLAEGYDQIVDGMQLRDSFVIYKESSVWRMDFIGGPYIYRFSKVAGISGALNRNCIVEIDGQHLVLSGSDVIVHDGQNVTSVLDKQTRRWLFGNIDANNIGLSFVFKNPYFNEVFICYPSIGSSVCDSAMVWNYVDKTVSFRSIPNLNHASSGPVDSSLGYTWSADVDTWSGDLTAWNGPDVVPNAARAIMASSDTKLYLLDGSASFNGNLPSAYLERRGLSLGSPEDIKLITSIRPRITGNVGQTVNVQIGSSNDPYTDPTYGAVMTHTIGTTVSNDCLVSGRYIAIKFSSGTAYQWRLDSFQMDVQSRGKW